MQTTAADATEFARREAIGLPDAEGRAAKRPSASLPVWRRMGRLGGTPRPTARNAAAFAIRSTHRSRYQTPPDIQGKLSQSRLERWTYLLKDGISPHDPNVRYSLTDMGLRVLNETVSETVNETVNESIKRSDVVINEALNEGVNEGVNVFHPVCRR